MKQKSYGLTKATITLISFILMAVIITLSVVLVNQLKSSMKALIDERMLDVSNTAAAMIDGDQLATLTKDDVGSVSYNQVADVLLVFSRNINLSYIYALKETEDGSFIFTVDPDPKDPAVYGEKTVYTSALYAASRGTPSVDARPVSDRWGTFYSSYSPVFDSSGNVAGIIGVDFDAKWFDAQVRKQMFYILIIGILSLAVGAVIVYLFTRQISRRFFQLNEELSVLSKDVEELTEEIVTSPDYEDSQVGQETDEEHRMLNASGDSIGVLSEKIRFIQGEIREYLDYAHQQAYTDSMTGVNNQSAYLRMIKEINQKIAEQRIAFSVCVFDLNGLKEINDNFGHEEGDQMIRNCAAVLKKTMGAKNIFRTGGDEFIAILPDINGKDVELLFSAINREVIAFNIKHKSLHAPVSFSKGYAVFDEKQDFEFRQVFKRADNAMYRDKTAHYEKYGNRRGYRGFDMN